MSLASWKKEFYPRSAARVPRRDALEHSIQKWTGLLKENLLKHEVYIEKEPFKLFRIMPHVTDGTNDLPINDKTCALCARYQKEGCTKCPLYKTRDHRCDAGVDSPYVKFTDTLKPNAMLVQLRRARKFNKVAP